MRNRKLKAIVAAVGMVATVLTVSLADDALKMSETAELVTVALEAVAIVYGVWRVPNEHTP